MSVEFIRPVLEGLAAAHAEGIIHRDIKPANIILVDPESARGGPPVRILDMGIAKSLFEVEKITLTDQFMGTPLYLAPEVLLNPVPASWSPAADVYAAGMILFLMVIGRLPVEPEGCTSAAA